MLGQAIPAPAGGWTWNDSWKSYVCAILEHEGSIDLYHGLLGPGVGAHITLDYVREVRRVADRPLLPHGSFRRAVSLYEGLKHSTATHLKALGADDRVLARLAGHRDPRSIGRYAKLEPGTIASALKRLREKK